jgi:hypothetical protein
VASNRFETNSNSAIASRLYFGWPKLAVWFCVTRKPSTLSWNVPSPPSSSPEVFCRLPGASIVRSTKLRPLRGSSVIWRLSTLLPSDELLVSTSGA